MTETALRSRGPKSRSETPAESGNKSNMEDRVVDNKPNEASRILIRSNSDDLIADWQPEPLVPSTKVDFAQHIVGSKPGKRILIDGIDCLNLGTHNYLGLAENKLLEEASIAATHKYGVGSCGPRAFYGTMDVHLKLEQEIAKFLGVEETVLYSFGFSTISSAIPAYIRHKDLVFIDEQCNFSIQQGLKAARCRTVTFKHNDCADLEQKIQDVLKEADQAKSRKLKLFIIVEGVYAKTGRLCPLKELVEIKSRHKIRLFVDESSSFGVLGPTGRGITEHFNVDIGEIDMTMASLENALCAFGGFCAGSLYLMDHQRLAGTGYCFSASLPPMQAQVALESLAIIQKSPSIVKGAQAVFAYANEKLASLTNLKNLSDELSPVKVLALKRSAESDDAQQRDKDEQVLADMCESILNKEHMAISPARYLAEELRRPIPSIKVFANAYLSADDIDRLVAVLESHSAAL